MGAPRVLIVTGNAYAAFAGSQSNRLVTIRKDTDRSLRKQGALGVFDRVIELLEAEWRVAECNALIERQRQLIEQLGNEDRDITSAQIMFDSLLVSLYLHLEDRHRLHALNGKAAEVREAGLAGVEKRTHVA